jgi:hypothetical protein
MKHWTSDLVLTKLGTKFKAAFAINKTPWYGQILYRAKEWRELEQNSS